MNFVPMYQLVIDAGNSRIKWGLFLENILQRTGILENGSPELLPLIPEFQQIEACIYASVRQDNLAWQAFINTFRHNIVLGHETPLPVRIRYDSRKSLGADRIANACGANVLFPGAHCLVIDAGTCMKYDLIEAEGVFAGGSISPGLQMRFEALHHYTGRLPAILPGPTQSLTGHSTESSIRTGVQTGILAECEAFIDYYQKQYSPLRIIITGGDASFFLDHLKLGIFASSDLTLIGLHSILSHFLLA